MVKEGRGRGIVVNIAEKTMLGQIADLASTGGQQRSPLRVELDRFVLLITIIALVLGVVVNYFSNPQGNVSNCCGITSVKKWEWTLLTLKLGAT